MYWHNVTKIRIRHKFINVPKTIITIKHTICDLGVDPKSVFCAFFKQGLCKKGDKCKFSHDPSVEGKAAKRNLYADNR